MQGESEVQGRGSGPDHSGSEVDHFKATLVLHLLYANEQSAAVAGHRIQGYATANVDSPVWFQNKDAFMGMVCKAFEDLWESMKNGQRSNGAAGS